MTLTSGQIKSIEDCLVIANEIKALSIENPELGFDLPIRDFITVMQMLTAQSYGSRIQNRMIKELGFKKVSARDNCGDCKDTFGDFWEVKCSIITPTNPSLNFVQVRPWQNIRYIGIAFDTRVKPTNIEFYRLDKSQMTAECEIMKASSAHGTKEANKNNSNKELRFDIKIDPMDTNYIRWQKYRSNFAFEKV
jgi:hypothetical protein